MQLELGELRGRVTEDGAREQGPDHTGPPTPYCSVVLDKIHDRFKI